MASNPHNPAQDRAQQPAPGVQQDTAAPSPTQPLAKPVMGEGSYEGTRDYQKSVGDYLRQADVQADAQAARPRSEEEARELQRAEREARSHAKTERGDDRMDDKKQVPRA